LWEGWLQSSREGTSFQENPAPSLRFVSPPNGKGKNGQRLLQVGELKVTKGSAIRNFWKRNYEPR
jgi:hypothetical protein